MPYGTERVTPSLYAEWLVAERGWQPTPDGGAECRVFLPYSHGDSLKRGEASKRAFGRINAARKPYRKELRALLDAGQYRELTRRLKEIDGWP